MRYLYSFLTYVAVPFILFRLWWKGRKAPEYRQRIGERFALRHIPENSQQGIWLHTVSVGEVIAAIPLVRAIMSQHPNLPIIITTMTPTGSARVKSAFGDNVYHCYIPYDIPGCVKRFIRKAKPKALIVLETELWPNLLHYCQRANVPVMLSNARLSEKSFKGYQCFRRSVRQLLSAITVLGAHAKADAQRFIRLGLTENKVHVTGSIKYELQLPNDLQQQTLSLKQWIGNRPIWVAGSTHEGEDEQVLAAHKKVLEQYPDTLLILAPRHPQRFDNVHELIQQQGLNVTRRSLQQTCDADTCVYLGDTMGELLLLMSVADVVFIGGSLVDVGGHNLLEPAALGIATITGWSKFNFVEINQKLEQADALRQVPDQQVLASQLIELFQQPKLRAQLGNNAKQVVAANRGALAANLKLLESIL